MATYRLAVHWFRRDLRITDNTALHAAAAQSDAVLPLYVLSDWKGSHHWTGPIRQHFLCGCLASLSKNLETIEGSLILRQGPADVAIRQLLQESKADALFFNRDPDPFGAATESRIENLCRELGIAFHGYHDVALHSPEEVLTQEGRPYRVFTPYSRNWLDRPKQAPLPKPARLRTPPGFPSESLPDVSHWGLAHPDANLPEPGEKAAHLRLKDALSKVIPVYAEQRDIPGRHGTSRLSQDFRFGLLSPRTVYAKIQGATEGLTSASIRQSAATYIKELAWREFYFSILHHFPEVLELEFQPEWRGLWWADPDEKFDAWKEGRTGFPIIDAGMRELRACGFMHNRVRMITAMFLTKDLHIDWRHGEQHFMQWLVDGEIASNNGGWQWSAGTGADAAPYFRIQNPWSQTKRYDPDGSYIRRWVPELENCETKQFFTPPAQPIAAGYPLPIIDHHTERNRTLAIFQKHKERRL